jgi:hypothetical protein
MLLSMLLVLLVAFMLLLFFLRLLAMPVIVLVFGTAAAHQRTINQHTSTVRQEQQTNQRS